MSDKENIQDEELESQNEEMTNEENTEEVVAEQLSPEEELEAKAKEATDKYLRLYSEFDNFRKRTQKEKLELYKTAGEDVIKALLPVLDDFERAQKAMEESDDIKGVKDGVKLIHDKILNILKGKGLEAADSAIGEKFDIEIHEAITQIPAPSKKEQGKVIDEVEKGYQLNGKMIRYAKVVVGK
jgi:molecular chaperone GrpE